MKYVLLSFRKASLSIYSALLSYPCVRSVKVSTQFANSIVCHGGLKAWAWSMKTTRPGRLLKAHAEGPRSEDPRCPVAGVQLQTWKCSAGSSSSACLPEHLIFFCDMQRWRFLKEVTRWPWYVVPKQMRCEQAKGQGKTWLSAVQAGSAVRSVWGPQLFLKSLWSLGLCLCQVVGDILKVGNALRLLLLGDQAFNCSPLLYM